MDVLRGAAEWCRRSADELGRQPSQAGPAVRRAGVPAALRWRAAALFGPAVRAAAAFPARRPPRNPYHFAACEKPLRTRASLSSRTRTKTKRPSAFQPPSGAVPAAARRIATWVAQPIWEAGRFVHLRLQAWPPTV